MPTVSGYAPGLEPPPASWAPTQGWGSTYSGPTQGGTLGLGYNPQIPLPTQTQPGAIGGNIGSLGSLYGLAGGINRFQNQQAALGLQQNLPGYQGLIGQSSQNIGQELQGQVPSDVVTQILQSAAERGIMTGSPGSANANAAYLRALGLTSIGQMQTGEQNLTAAIGRTPQAAPLGLENFLVTPSQQQEAAAANALYGAAPNPTAVQQANLAAARSGLGQGLGATQWPGVVAPTGFQWSSGAGLPSSSTSDQTQIGGVDYGPGQTPATAFQDWSSWYSSLLPQTTTTASSPLTPQGQVPVAGGATWQDANALLNQPDISSLLS